MATCQEAINEAPVYPGKHSEAWHTRSFFRQPLTAMKPLPRQSSMGAGSLGRGLSFMVLFLFLGEGASLD